MSAITAKMVKDLRDRTNAGMMDCKKALAEAEGDIEQAMKILREKGIAKGAKRAGRTAAEGLVGIAVNDAKTEAAIIEFNCETDFVARNDEFQTLTQQIADAALAAGADSPQAAFPLSLPNGKSVEESINDLLAKIGEKLTLNRVGILKGDLVQHYIHPPGKIGVLIAVTLGGANADTAAKTLNNISMHIAAMNPRFLNESEVDEETLNAEREIYANKARGEGKPENIIPKIVEGQIRAFYKEACLVDNVFAMDNKKTIKDVVKELSKEAGGEITITGFLRYQVGETAQPEEEAEEE